MTRSTAAEWSKRVEQWQSSGLTAKEFAEQTGVNASTLTKWRWKLSRRGSAGETAGRVSRAANGSLPADESPRPTGVNALSFVELPAVEVSGAGAVEVVLSEQITVRVPLDADEVTLGRVFRAIGVVS